MCTFCVESQTVPAFSNSLLSMGGFLPWTIPLKPRAALWRALLVKGGRNFIGSRLYLKMPRPALWATLWQSTLSTMAGFLLMPPTLPYNTVRLPDRKTSLSCPQLILELKHSLFAGMTAQLISLLCWLQPSSLPPLCLHPPPPLFTTAAAAELCHP